MSKEYYFYQKLPASISEWNPNQTICLYMKFGYFIKMLENKQFWVNSKCKFDDTDESNKNLKYCLKFAIANQPVDNDELEKHQKEVHEFLESYKELKYLPTSCWTYDMQENNLMWRSFTADDGVRLRTKLSSFIEAVDTDGYDIICGFIQYLIYYKKLELEVGLFSKNTSYVDEREFRIYFVPKTEDKLNDIRNDKQILLHIENPVDVFEQIVLSPYIENKKEVRSFLVERCNISPKKIKESVIRVKNKKPLNLAECKE